MYNAYGMYQPQTVSGGGYSESGYTGATASSRPPSLSNSRAWFDYFDRDRSGTLDREEVVTGLVVTMKLPSHKLQSIRDSVYSIWTVFDHNNNGSIDKREFCSPGGLGESLLAIAQSHENTNTNTTGPSSSSSSPYYPQPSAPPAQYHSTHNQPQTVHQPPQTAQTKIIRVGIPNGVEPGQQVQIPTGDGRQAIVTIPDRSLWIYANTGQPTFDCSVPLPNPIPVVLGTQVTNNQSSSTYTSSLSNTNNYSAPPPPSSSQPNYYATNHNTTTRTSWQSYETIPARPYQPPTLGMTQVDLRLSSTFIRPSGRRKALIIGINYTGTRAELRGCVNDAQNMKNLLIRQGFPNDTCHMVMLTDTQSDPNYRPTASNIFRAMAWLIQGVSEGDVMFLHFSGHGSQQPDQTGHEADGLNETILPLDFDNKQITDDELWGSLVYPLPSGTRLTALMDCCHSGTGLDLPFEYKFGKNNKRPFGFGGSKRPTDTNARGQWIEDVNPAHSKGDVVLFSGCEDSQTSADAYDQNQAGGAMTQSFISAFEENPYATYPDFMVSIHKALKRRRFSQRPQLTSSQAFDANQRVFSFVEGIEPNTNQQIGRIKRRHVRAKKAGGPSPFEALIAGGGALAGALMLGELLF